MAELPECLTAEKGWLAYMLLFFGMLELNGLSGECKSRWDSENTVHQDITKK